MDNAPPGTALHPWPPKGPAAFIAVGGTIDAFEINVGKFSNRVLAREVHHLRYTRANVGQAYVKLMELRLSGHTVPPEDFAWLRYHMTNTEDNNAHTK